MVSYALLLALIGLVTITSVILLRDNTAEHYCHTAHALDAADDLRNVDIVNEIEWDKDLKCCVRVDTKNTVCSPNPFLPPCTRDDLCEG